MNPRADGYPRIVITGIGAVTNLGCSPDETWDSMRNGRSGISTIQGDSFDEWDDKWAVKIGGQIKNWDPLSVVDARQTRRIDRCAILGLDAAAQAIEQSGIKNASADPTRLGVIIGSGIGGIQTIEESVMVLSKKGPHRLNPFTVPRLMVNSCAGLISIEHGLEGPSDAHATACASAGHAMADAFHSMRRGEADLIVTGGTEAACTPLCLGAFMTMKALSTRNDEPEKASRPFDVDRDGFLLAEGAGMLVLETEDHAKARGATILAELAGCGASSDAFHITAPDESGKGAMNSMRLALKSAGCSPEDIDYINAHGTSTPLGDAAEVAAVQTLFADHALKSKSGSLLMSSTKSMHGHCLGASGGVEMIACINAIRENVAPPTINCDNPDETFDLDFVPHTAREAEINTVMNNTFGFGGHNVTLIAKRYDG
ncbi:MAG: beta-ketoacyl-ACP synthase II [Planctomycetota bacterium]|jgi:3-oxoacyl-[acyl-carrier-protein] synthase II